MNESSRRRLSCHKLKRWSFLLLKKSVSRSKCVISRIFKVSDNIGSFNSPKTPRGWHVKRVLRIIGDYKILFRAPFWNSRHVLHVRHGKNLTVSRKTVSCCLCSAGLHARSPVVKSLINKNSKANRDFSITNWSRLPMTVSFIWLTLCQKSWRWKISSHMCEKQQLNSEVVAFWCGAWSLILSFSFGCGKVNAAVYKNIIEQHFDSVRATFLVFTTCHTAKNGQTILGSWKHRGYSIYPPKD